MGSTELSTLYTAINAVMKEVGYVQKGGTNREQGYKFAGEAAILGKLRPELVKQGLMIIPLRQDGYTHETYTSAKGTLMHRTTMGCWFRIAHISGESMDIMLTGVGVDTGDKDVNKAHTIAFKYAWRQTFGIETGDDPDETTPEEGVVKAARTPSARKVEKLQPEKPSDSDVPPPLPARSDLMPVTVEAVSAKPTSTGKARYAFKIVQIGDWAGCFDTGMCERNLGDPTQFKGAAMAHVFENQSSGKTYWNLDWIERPAKPTVTPAAKPAPDVDEYNIGELGPPLDMDDPTDPMKQLPLAPMSKGS
jgi:hypothetical protein